MPRASPSKGDAGKGKGRSGVGRGKGKGKGRGNGCGKGKGKGRGNGCGKGKGGGGGGGMVQKAPASPQGAPQGVGKFAKAPAASLGAAKRSGVMRRTSVHAKAKLQLSCSLYKRQAKELGFNRVSNSGTIALAAAVQKVLESIVERASLCATRRRKKRIAVSDISQALQEDDDLREVLDDPHLQSGGFPTLYQPREFLMGLRLNARRSKLGHRRTKKTKQKPMKKMMKTKKA